MLDLCNALADIGGDNKPWVRLHYVYPYPHVDEIIPLMADGKILPYLDIHFQHGSPKVLKAMKRPGAIDNTLSRIQGWREVCPDITIRSTFIVGFPGETEEDFQATLEVVRQVKYDQIFSFKYSERPGVPAARLADDVPTPEKKRRLAELMAAQDATWAETAAACTGVRLHAEDGAVIQARTLEFGFDIQSLIAQERTGVVISSSRLPRSRSRTMATAVNMVIVMVRMTPIRPGTVFTAERRSGL